MNSYLQFIGISEEFSDEIIEIWTIYSSFQHENRNCEIAKHPTRPEEYSLLGFLGDLKHFYQKQSYGSFMH